MFIGHYGAALAIRSADDSPSLGKLFIAVQWVDVLFTIFVLVGLEKIRIVPGFTEYNSYDLVFMPYTHSVVAHVVWAALAMLAARFLVKWSWRASGLLALAVFSHLLLDLPMHTPDMPLAGDDTTKLGFGLWNNLPVAMAVELTAFLVGLGLFLRRFGSTRRLWEFLIALLAILIATPFLPAPGSDTEFAVQGLVAYLLLAAWAGWAAKGAVARNRTSVGMPRSPG